MKKKLSKSKNQVKNKRDVIDGREARRLGVLMERMDDKIDLLAEQHGDIIQTQELHTRMIGSMKEDLEIMKMNIEFIKGSLKKKVDIEEFVALERRVSLLEKRR